MSIERVIISGGGTGGHIFPAIAIANEIRRRNPEADILFVGANGKMEMEKVPAAGYEIKGLDIVGFQRKFSLSNFSLPFKILKSISKAKKILREFKPQVVVGVGGFASGPTLRAAHKLNIPTLIQEQNSFPGKTNKLLASKVKTICVAYEGLERFFPKQKIVLTGNPVRSEMVDIAGKRAEAMQYYNFDPALKTILVVGGSLGARTLNDSMRNFLDVFKKENVQVLWQCGKHYYPQLSSELELVDHTNVECVQFIARMDYAYALADVIISRAGAIAVSELSLVGKPAILVPSPNVAEDHQTKNAMALVEKDAALLIRDIEAREELVPEALDLLKDPEKQAKLSEKIKRFCKPDATAAIINELEKLIV